MNAVMYNRNQSSFLTVISYAVETSNRSATDFLRQFMTQTTAKPMELCPLIPPDIRKFLFNLSKTICFSDAANSNSITINPAVSDHPFR